MPQPKDLEPIALTQKELLAQRQQDAAIAWEMELNHGTNPKDQDD